MNIQLSINKRGSHAKGVIIDQLMTKIVKRRKMIHHQAQQNLENKALRERLGAH